MSYEDWKDKCRKVHLTPSDSQSANGHTVFYVGGGADGKTFFRSFETSKDVLHDLLKTCRNDVVAYYSCWLIDNDLKCVTIKQEAEANINYAYAEYCKTYTPDIDKFCSDVEDMLSIFSESYIGMPVKVITNRLKYAISFLDEWRSQQGEVETPKPKQKRKVKKTFRDIIQYEDPDKLLERLHALIDGKRGANVGAVLCHVHQNNYLMRLPTQREFESEFTLIGSWEAIRKYMTLNQNNKHDINILDKSNRIVIFK